MKYLFLFLSFFILMSCAVFQPKTFSELALQEKLVTLNRDSITFKEVLQKTKKEKFIQIFTSYCPYSQDSFDDVLQFQEENPEKEYIFLSVDHTYHDWKRGLEYVKPKGAFYYIPKKDEGILGKFLKLKTIPRFLKVDAKGEIKVYKTSKVTSKLK